MLKTDDSLVFQRGIFRQGEQYIEVKLLDGPDKGEVIPAMNLLQGAIELEWFYQPGEIGIVGYSKDKGEVVTARLLEPLHEKAVFLGFCRVRFF